MNKARMDSTLKSIAEEIDKAELTRFEFDLFETIMFTLGRMDPTTTDNWLRVCLARGLLRELPKPDPRASRLFVRGQRFNEYLTGEPSANP
jgi:hypothetical protein